MSTKLSIDLRWLCRKDLPEVVAIEKACFSHPFNEDNFTSLLRDRNTIGIVAENENSRVLGFMIYELRRHSIHILDIAVDSFFFRNGIGSLLLYRLKLKLSSNSQRKSITIRVKESNLRALNFFKSEEFIVTKIDRGWYDDSDDDAFFMKYKIPE